jgi:4-hydroxy-tetrahydrodipicolinate reductase
MRVSLYGAGQFCGIVAAILRARDGVEVSGPHGRDERDAALGSGADVVVIGTTSFLDQVAPDIRDAVLAGSNVITTAEEAACPWVVDQALADELDGLARERGVTILGAGLNPGFAFDALVLTALGAVAEFDALHVERVVDLSGFGRTVSRRLGIGYDAAAFAAGVDDGTVCGHIGFPQSMRVVAHRLGVRIDAMEHDIEPLIAPQPLRASHVEVAAGESGGFVQRYRAIVDGKVWFDAHFTGHVDLASIGLEPRDEIAILGTPVRLLLSPGLNAQSGSSAVVANSLRRVVEAPAGWLTVADLPPATPA